MLPLEKSRLKLEQVINNFVEVIDLVNPNCSIDPQISIHLKKINLNKRRDEFLALYLKDFPFFKR